MKARIGLTVASLLVAWLLASCAPPVTAPSQAAAPVAVPTERPEVTALRSAQQLLEEYLGRRLDQLDVAYGTAEWPDMALGCPEVGVDYAPIATAGYQFEITVDGVVFEIHTARDGSRAVLCPSPETGVTPGNPHLVAMEAARSLLAGILGSGPEAIAAAVTTEPGRWSRSDMGCPAQGKVYEQAEIAGYRFQFVHDDALYDLRASGDGRHAVLCGDAGLVGEEGRERASGTRDELPEPVRGPFEAALGVLAGLARLAPEALTLDSIEWQPITFASSALGCPEPGMGYLDVMTEGYSFWLGYADDILEIHTDLDGRVAVLCEEPVEPAGSAPVAPAAPPGVTLTPFSNPPMGFGISYPSGWWVQADPVSGEAHFRPGNSLPTFGMQVTRLPEMRGDVDAWLASYQADLGASDPSASQDAVVQTVGPDARSQRFSRDLNETRVMERVTFFPEGYRIRQWAPADQWGEWDERFVQMLASLDFLGPE